MHVNKQENYYLFEEILLQIEIYFFIFLNKKNFYKTGILVRYFLKIK